MLYIDDILDSASAIKEFIAEMDFNEFVTDRKTYSATIREYIVIGEAVSAILDILEERIPSYPLKLIKDFRNVIVHEYFGVDAKIVWDLTKQELDTVIGHINAIKLSDIGQGTL